MTEPPLPEESLFAQALEIASAAERAAFLDRACGENPALRAGVDALLRAHDRSGDLLDRPEHLALTTDLTARERPGTHVGPYKLLEQIGEGGMGTVWMAEQTEPIRRQVAVKVIKEGMGSGHVLARFEAERQALALMEHPNIAKVLDAGRTPSGRPYFVMELVKGQPITTYCDEKRLGVRQRLELFADACRAVQHAHQKGIIHRDLKPSNVLVAPYDGRPVVKVIDFGVAKATGQRLTDRTLFTQFGALVGTPEYMSPEQAEINNQDVDTRSDIYSLGVLLYELLTGSTPLTRKRIHEAAILEVLRVIREEEPPRPSTRLSASKAALPSISAQRQTEPTRLTRLVRGELDWIVMKALEKDRTRRYETANGFAGDVERYLADEAVHACPPSAAYRLRKFTRRNKAVLAATALIFLVMVVGTVISTWQAIRATQAGDAERAAREEAQGHLARATKAEDDLRDKLWASYLGEAHALRLGRGPGQCFGSLAAVRKALQLPLPPGRSLAELRNEAAAALTLPDVEVVQELEAPSAGDSTPSFDAALERFARTDPQGNVSVRRVADDSEIVRIPGPGRATRAVLSPDGHVVAVAHPETMRLKVYRLTEPGWELLHESTNFPGHPWLVGFCPDNRRLVYCDRDQQMTLVTLASGQVARWPVKGAYPGALLVRPDGRQVMFWRIVDGQSCVNVYDLLTGEVQANLPHPTILSSYAWRPDGRMIATCCNDRKIRLWDTATWRQTLVLEGHKQESIRCIFSPEGDRLLSNDWGWLLRVWDVQTGRQLLATPMPCETSHFSPDGRLAVGYQNQVKITRIATGHGFRTLARRSAASSRPYAVVHGDAALSPDGRLLAVTTEERSCALVDPASGAELAVIPSCRTIRFEASGALLTYGPAGLCRWPVETDLEKGCCRVGAPQVLFASRSDDRYGSSADGRVLAIPNYAQGALLLHRDRAGPPMVLEPQEDVRYCAVSPDGRWAATGNHSNTKGVGAKVWDAASGKPVKDFPMGNSCAVGFSPDGQWLVTTGGGCRLWAVGTWAAGPVIGEETDFAFSPDGRVLAVVGDDYGIRLVETATGREYVRLDSTEQTRFAPKAFTPDGTRLIALGLESQALHVWDLRLIRQRLAKMGLDWDAPPYPPPVADAAPLSVTVDLGGKTP